MNQRFEMYPTGFAASGKPLQHSASPPRCQYWSLNPFYFISFCPTSRISDYASRAAQLNANVGVLVEATQIQPTSPCWTQIAADTQEKVMGVQVWSRGSSPQIHSEALSPAAKVTPLLWKWFKVLLRWFGKKLLDLNSNQQQARERKDRWEMIRWKYTKWKCIKC